jgi:hypothetical protein
MGGDAPELFAWVEVDGCSFIFALYLLGYHDRSWRTKERCGGCGMKSVVI